MPNAYNMYNATILTVVPVRQDQTAQTARQLKIEGERNKLANLRVLKITSGNIVKQLKIQQKMHMTTKVRKTIEVAIKQIAT